ncbi:GPW/gp25 family protein [Pseudovibrio brasiliensis]|uniref:GPW/gp25 family protein n=1 Tax=Pseudovibrio brasiliensis TaxID=1898042 RepID=A0ABX8AZZ4_9HYPH|nr:GPW/gp25 family protein [Pseudovibrio brasiliensis]QUS59206.1 GPW/gp25 family protein [Pseudovibrio brasiliensis]
MSYKGMSREDGKELSGIEHVRQSLKEILMTRKGSRVIRRDFGCGIAELIDRPMSQELKLDIAYEVSEAVARWEPRFKLIQVEVIGGGPDGRTQFDLTGIYYPRGHLGDYSGQTQSKIRISV